MTIATFSVTVVMGQEYLPRRLGIASGVTSETILAALMGRFPPPRIDLGERHGA